MASDVDAVVLRILADETCPTVKLLLTSVGIVCLIADVCDYLPVS
jgi:hypothetical protein